MSKRMREKRRERLARKAATGDVGALEHLAERAPAAAARALMARFAGGDDDEQLVALASRLAAGLRHRGQHLLVADLAAATGRHTSVLRLEEALAAFAAGDDARAARAIDGDPRVAALIEPLLSAAGDPGARARRRSARESWFCAAGRAVAAARAGRQRTARAALDGVPAPVPGRWPVDALRAAVEWASAHPGSGTSRRWLVKLLECAPVLADPEVRAVLFDEAVVAGQSRGLVSVLAEPERRELLQRFAASASASDLEPGVAATVIARAGAGAFDEASRGNALVFSGFGLLSADPGRARAVFAQAIASGGDMVEALRGMWMASRAADRTGDSVSDTSEIAARLVHALEAGLDGAPAAAAVASLMAHRCAEVSHDGLDRSPVGRARVLADEWVGRMRRLVDRVGPSGAALEQDADLCEAGLCVVDQPARALELAGRVLSREPANVEAWSVKLAVGGRSEDGRYAEWVEHAARATGDHAMVIAARQERLRRGEVRPFEALSDGDISAPAMAAELVWGLGARIIDAGGAERCDDCAAWHPLECEIPEIGEEIARLLLEAEPYRARLAVVERAAFDAAAIACACACARMYGCAGAPVRVMSEAIEAWRDDTGQVARLAQVLVYVHAPALLPAVRAAVRAGATPRALGALVRGVARSDGRLAQRAFGVAVPVLDAATVRELRGGLSRAGDDGEGALARLIAELDAVLDPGLSIADIEEDGVPLDGPGGGAERGVADRDADREQREALARIMRGFRPHDDVSGLDAAQIASMMKKIAELAAKPPTAANARRLEKILGSYAPPAVEPGGKATAPARSRRDRNTRKRSRRARR